MEQTIFDVANWFLFQEPLMHKKVQKLCYYAEAWSETLLGEPITTDAIFEAQVHGPINQKLFNKYHPYLWKFIDQVVDCPKFSPEKEEVLLSVWETYRDCTGTQLENLACQEDPWLKQRAGLSRFEKSTNIIQVEDMVQYYSQVYEPDLDETVENFKNEIVSDSIVLPFC